MPFLAIDITKTSTNFQNAVTNVNWAQPSWDLFIVLFFVVAGLVYGLSLGRERVVAILVSVYMALAVVSNAPYIGILRNGIRDSNTTLARVFAFIAIFIVLFVLLVRSSTMKGLSGSDEKGSWWQAMLFSFLHVGLLISIVLSYLPVNAIQQLAPMTQRVFTSDTGRFLWVLGPILALIMFRGSTSRRKFKYDL